MTLILALRAQEGVVMASDGQATAPSGVPTRTSTEKLDLLHGKIAFGCAGSAGLRQRVSKALHKRIDPDACTEPLDAGLRDQLFGVVNDVQRHAVDSFVKTEPYDKAHSIEVLFAGHSDEGSWIYEVTRTGDDQRHKIGEAIGHGRHFAAYALVSAEHYELRNRGLAQLRLLAYRAVDDAIRTDASGLGPPVHMIQVSRDGAMRLDQNDIEGVKGAINAWQGHERDIFVEQDGELPSSRAGDSGARGLDPPQG
jgi:20S proteasome alpha/beta subunit